MLWCYCLHSGVSFSYTGTVQPVNPEDETSPAFDDLADELTSSMSLLSPTIIIPSSSSLISPSSSLAPLTSVVVVKETSYISTAVTPSPQATSYTSGVLVPPTPIHATSITVATDALDGTKDITLPVNSVKIFASTWPKLHEGVCVVCVCVHACLMVIFRGTVQLAVVKSVWTQQRNHLR